MVRAAARLGHPRSAATERPMIPALVLAGILGSRSPTGRPSPRTSGSRAVR
jgi:hypothetical protein